MIQNKFSNFLILSYLVFRSDRECILELDEHFAVREILQRPSRVVQRMPKQRDGSNVGLRAAAVPTKCRLVRIVGVYCGWSTDV